jgi:predicted nucleic acid-binding protein
MILVDTSIWIDHLHRGDAALADLLADGEVLLHPYVRTEIALGSIRDRQTVLAMLGAIPAAPVVSTEELLVLVESNRFFATGLGLTDAHLISSALVVDEALIWTRDKRLEAVAIRLGVSATA